MLQLDMILHITDAEYYLLSTSIFIFIVVVDPIQKKNVCQLKGINFVSLLGFQMCQGTLTFTCILDLKSTKKWTPGNALVFIYFIYHCHGTEPKIEPTRFGVYEGCNNIVYDNYVQCLRFMDSTSMCSIYSYQPLKPPIVSHPLPQIPSIFPKVHLSALPAPCRCPRRIVYTITGLVQLWSSWHGH